MWKFCFFLLLPILVASCSLKRTDPEAAELHLRLGSSYLAKGDNPRALKELIRAAELDPNSAVILNNLGLAYYFRGKPLLAIEQIERALKINDAYSEARNNLARIYIDIAKYDLAIELLEKVIADLTYTEPHKAWMNLGLAYFRKKQFLTASEKFVEAIKLRRKNCYAYSYYGRSLFEMKVYPKAEEALEKAIQLCKNVKFPEPHYFSGMNYYKMGRKSKAITRFEELISLFPLSEKAKEAKNMINIIR